MLRTVPHRITNRVQELLLPDGFKQRGRRDFIKKWDGDWIALISIEGSPHSLSPRIGVGNSGFSRFYSRARKMATSKRPPNSPGGPPIISTYLDRLIVGDTDCQRHVSWRYKGDGHELETRVADDLVLCLREKGFPFFDQHVTVDSVMASVFAGLVTGWTNYFIPIMFLESGRREEAVTFAGHWRASADNPNIGDYFQRYFDALIEIFDKANGAPA